LKYEPPSTQSDDEEAWTYSQLLRTLLSRGCLVYGELTVAEN
jgi:hypothetical protein